MLRINHLYKHLYVQFVSCVSIRASVHCLISVYTVKKLISQEKNGNYCVVSEALLNDRVTRSKYTTDFFDNEFF